MKVPFVVAQKNLLDYEPAAPIAAYPDDCAKVEVFLGWLRSKDLE